MGAIRHFKFNDIKISMAYILITQMLKIRYPLGFPAYFDMDRVIDHLNRSPTFLARNRSSHTLVKAFIKAKFEAWVKGKTHCLQDGKIPGFGDHNALFALYILFKGIVTCAGWQELNIEWLFTAPGSDRLVPAFWKGANLSSADWWSENSENCPLVVFRDSSKIELSANVMRSASQDKWLPAPDNNEVENLSPLPFERITTAQEREQEARENQAREADTTAQAAQMPALGFQHHPQHMQEYPAYHYQGQHRNYQNQPLSHEAPTKPALPGWDTRRESYIGYRSASINRLFDDRSDISMDVPPSANPSTSKRDSEAVDDDSDYETGPFAVIENLRKMTLEERLERVEELEVESYKHREAYKRSIGKGISYDEAMREVNDEQKMSIGEQAMKAMKKKLKKKGRGRMSC